MRILDAVVLAAGYGSRLGSITKVTPKPLIDVCGKPVIAHVIDLLLQGGITRLHINLHWHGEKIRDYLFTHYAHVPTFLYEEEPELLGTGGAIVPMLTRLGNQPFIIANSDTILTATIDQILMKYEDLGYPDLLLSTSSNAKSAGFGEVCVADNRVTHIAGYTVNIADSVVSKEVAFSGARIVTSKLWLRPTLTGKLDFIADILIPWMTSGNPVYAHVTENEFYDVGTASRLEYARQALCS